MIPITRNVFILVLGIVLGAVAVPSLDVHAEKEASAPADRLPLDDLRTFTEVFAKIKSDYVEAVDDKQLLDYAIRGMLSGLDPHSAYLDAEAYKELQIGTTGEFGGLGIEVGMEDGFVKVIAPIDDTPAQRAGVLAGDLIIRLDDRPVKGMTLNEAVQVMRGKPGSPIVLTIVREGVEKPIKLTILRDVIHVKSVKFRTLEPGYAYLRITQFQSQTGPNLLQAVSKLKKDNGGTLKGLVLDLRNNPGGVLNAAVSVSDAFLDKGLIVYTEGRVADAVLRFNAKPNDLLNGAPMVVLVNGGSASASEIVAGALQDHKRAVIMGSKTFGKGSVQTILPMQNSAALKLTTARYFTPSGRSIQAEGIIPDIPLENIKLAQTEQNELDRVTEADLSGHLENSNGKDKAKQRARDLAERAGGGSAEQEEAELSLAESDYPLYEALNLLRGMSILKARQP